MAEDGNSIEVFLEIGKKKVFAGAVRWPGWCRSGRDEETALQALFECGSRYGQILRGANLGFRTPEEIYAFKVVERVEGNATTDFGAPDATLLNDGLPLVEGEIERLQTLLKSCWAAFDQAVRSAEGVELQKGPRGGGRDLGAIQEHVIMADEGYLKRIGWKLDKDGWNAEMRFSKMRESILDGFAACAEGELPTVGPRGGKRWKPRVFVRRVAWHVIDHAWEIEDRIPSL